MSHADLVGRADESRALRALLTRARNGLSESIVLRGDPGIGKTALLNSVTDQLTGIDVIRCDGFEAELTMPYAALHRLGRPLLDHLSALPERQQQALAVAWGADGPAPDRYLVGLGILGLVAAAASERPLVCVIDDAQWLDSESRDVLAFVARRLQAESAVLLFASRDSSDADTDVPADLGRAHLLYGEWLRRLRRRRDAREQLQHAIDIFDRIEAPSFGERARAELSATGVKVRTRHVVGGVELSSQEAAVAQMAAAGKTNAEIGTALFISANTVDYHLRKVFGKLAISSRRQLGEHFGQS